MNISKGSTLILTAFVLASFLNYIFYLVLAWLLKPSEYGIVGVFLAFLMILSFILTSGTPQTVMKRISSGENVESALRNGILANLLLGIIIAILFYVSLAISMSYKAITLLLSFVVLITSISMVLQYALLGLFKFKSYAFIAVANPFFKTIFPIAFVLAGFSVFGVFAGILITATLTLLLSLFFVRVEFWKTKNPLSLSFFSQSGSMLLGTLSIMFLMSIDIIAVKFLAMGSAETLAGYYQSAIVLARFPVWITLALMMSVFPYISKNTGDAKTLISASLKYVLAFLIPVSIALIIAPESYLSMLFPEAYLLASDALRTLAIGMTFLALAIVLGRSFQAEGKEKHSAISLTLAVVVQIVLLMLLVPKYGIVGGAAATTVASFSGLIPLMGSYIKDYRPELDLRITIPYSILVAIIYWLPKNSKLEIVTATIAAGAVYLLSLFVLRIITARDVETIISGVIPKESYPVKKVTGLVSALNGIGK